MSRIPWIIEGKNVRILGDKKMGESSSGFKLLSFQKTGSNHLPEVSVSRDGSEMVMKAWQVVNEGEKTFHVCHNIEEGLKFFEWQGYENNGNCILMDNGVSKIIVDSGHYHLLGSLLVALDNEGISVDSIKAALYTHCHPDHFDSAKVFAEAGAKIGLNSREKDYLMGEGGMLFTLFGASIPDISFDLPLDKGDIEIEGFRLRILHTPGHSPGSVCIYWEEKKTLIAGDVVFPEGAFGRCDFPGGSYRTLLESFESFEGLEINHLLCGHGGPISGSFAVKEAIKESRSNLRAVVFSPW